MPIFNIGPSIDSLANDFINANVHPDANFGGTLADLQQQILVTTNQCADYVHQKNALHNRANARSVCQQKINALYQPIVAQFQSVNAQQDSAVQKILTQGNAPLYGAIAIVILFLLTVVIILK